MGKTRYYDGTKLLSMKDLHGSTPEIYIVTTNRSGGKTTFFGRYFVNRFKKYGEKFCLLYRFNYELDDVADKFFNDLNTLFFKGDSFESKRKANGIYHELYLNEQSCGYAISLNSADTIKKYSHLFSDVQRMLLDEFQSETNHYCPDEIKKFISVHTSIARGQGKQVRYVPVFMLSNYVSLLNPYYAAWGISSQLKSDTKFLRGDGFVLENGFVDTASEAQKFSGFNRAFSGSDYVKTLSEKIYLNDNSAFVEKPAGKGVYTCTLKYEGCEYAIREYREQGIVYVDNSVDVTYPLKISVSTQDHNVNYLMLKRNDAMIQAFRWFFEHGCFRFKDLKCKEALIKAISY